MCSAKRKNTFILLCFHKETFGGKLSRPKYAGDERTLKFIVEDKAEKNKQRPFILFEDQKIGYEEFNEKTNRIAHAFLDLGIHKEDKVSILMTNCPEYILTWFALAKIGAIEVPIYERLRGPMLLYRLEHSESKALVTEPKFLDTLKPVEDQMKKLKHIIVNPKSPPENTSYEDRFNIVSFNKMLQGSRCEPEAKAKTSDIFAIMYTSGTTGPPKGAMLPHGWLFRAAEDKIKVMGTSPRDVIFNCFSMCNPTGQLETTFTAMMADASVAHVKRFSASKFWDQIKKFRCTEFVYMGGILGYLLKQPKTSDDRNHSVRAAWGAACPKRVWTEFEKRFGVKIVEIYGTTEIMQVTQTPPEAPKTGSCGKAVEMHEVKIFDKNDNECEPLQVGEIVVRPKISAIIFAGYYKDAERTLASMSNLWYHTGDLGYFDEDGYLYFHQRKSFAMRIKGHLISTWEIEQTINSHPKISESVAFGVPSEFGEDECKVIIVPKEEVTMRPEEIIGYCSESLPSYMVPRYVEIARELKKTHTDRVVIWEYVKEGVGKAWDRLKARHQIESKHS